VPPKFKDYTPEYNSLQILVDRDEKGQNRLIEEFTDPDSTCESKFDQVMDKLALDEHRLDIAQRGLALCLAYQVQCDASTSAASRPSTAGTRLQLPAVGRPSPGRPRERSTAGRQRATGARTRAPATRAAEGIEPV
jgi:hypothetical protein